MCERFGIIRYVLLLPLSQCLLFFWLIASEHVVYAADPAIESSPQSLRARVNLGGPEDWPETNGLSTGVLSKPEDASPLPSEPAQLPLPEAASEPPATPASPVDSQSGTSPAVPPPPVKDMGQAASGLVQGSSEGLKLGDDKHEKTDVPELPREVIYVDEKGNPVPKPPEPDKMMAEAERLIDENKIDEALQELDKIRALTDITSEMREKVLYHISDCIWSRYVDNPLAGYEAIVSSTNEAMNANLRSPNVPGALLRLGLANVNVGNLQDAAGYIVALYRRYPDYPGVSQGFTALGKEQLKRGFSERAEQSFSLVLDKYPESPYLQAAAVGLSYALFNQKKNDQAYIILDFISKRWPRYYIDDPDFLLLQAGNEEALGKFSETLDSYWLYINLDPGHEGNDALLLKMGDLYQRNGDTRAAGFIYHEIERRYSGKSTALIAGMRLLEKGVYDSPITYEQMTKVFAEMDEPALVRLYSALTASSNILPEAVLARLKQAMLLYWDKQYTNAMGKAADFIDSYPEDANVQEARELIWQAFQKELANSLTEKNYGRILILWNGFPLVRERYGPIDARLRYALAQGWLERGDDAQALGLLAEFLKSPMDTQYGEAAFTEYFNRYLQAGEWGHILDLGKLVAGWNMNPALRNQLDYATALSAQNLNLTAQALAMWKQLLARTDIPLYQRAYAVYFLARDAENRRDIRDSYMLNRQVIDLFTQLQDERSDKADPQRIKDAVVALMDICEVDNRIPEALDWVSRYSAYTSEDSPEYPGLRFREARLYRKLGDAVRARSILEDIVKRAPDSPFGKAAVAELRTFEVSRDLQNYMPGAAGAPSQ
jgi:TolA-binding protein